jgi:hypothetical protein
VRFIHGHHGRLLKHTDETRRKISLAHRGRPGKIPSPETRRKMSEAHKGRQQSPEWSRKIREAQSGEKSRLWKGQDAAYVTIHRWMLRHYQKNGICSDCARVGKTHWANIDHQYRRVRSDWTELCPKCHKKFDREHHPR